MDYAGAVCERNFRLAESASDIYYRYYFASYIDNTLDIVRNSGYGCDRGYLYDFNYIGNLNTLYLLAYIEGEHLGDLLIGGVLLCSFNLGLTA